jgi:hypothetical protein
MNKLKIKKLIDDIAVRVTNFGFSKSAESEILDKLKEIEEEIK